MGSIFERVVNIAKANLAQSEGSSPVGPDISADSSNSEDTRLQKEIQDAVMEKMQKESEEEQLRRNDFIDESDDDDYTVIETKSN